MKKLKKIVVLLIGISLLKTTTLAMEKEEKKINSNEITNKLETKQKIEEKIGNLLEEARKLEENFDLDVWHKNLKNAMKTFDLINVTWPKIKSQMQNRTEPYNKSYHEILKNIQETIMHCLPAILAKDQFYLIATPLQEIKKNNEYKNINDSTKTNVDNFLRKYFRFSIIFKDILTELNIVIVQTSDLDELMERENIKEKLKNLNYSEKTIKYIDDVIERSMDFSEKKGNIGKDLYTYIDEFNIFYEGFNKRKFNLKISENKKNFLNYLFKVLKIEMINKQIIDSFIEFKRNSKQELSYRQKNYVFNENTYFDKISETYEKLTTALSVINKLEENKDIKTVESTDSAIISNAKIFLDSLKTPKLKNYIKENKNIINNLLPCKKLFEKILSGEMEYKGRIINISKQKIEEKKKYVENLESIKNHYELQLSYAKKDLENIGMDQKFKKEIDEMQEFIDDCNKIKNLYNLYFQFWEKLENESKLNLEQSPITAAIIEWNKIKPQLEEKQKNILNMAIALFNNNIILPTDITRDFKDIISNLIKNSNLILTDDVKEAIGKIIIDLEAGLLKLRNFHSLNLYNMKKQEKECKNIDEKKQFKNIKREYELFYSNFNTAIKFFTNILNNK